VTLCMTLVFHAQSADTAHLQLSDQNSSDALTKDLEPLCALCMIRSLHAQSADTTHLQSSDQNSSNALTNPSAQIRALRGIVQRADQLRVLDGALVSLVCDFVAKKFQLDDKKLSKSEDMDLRRKWCTYMNNFRMNYRALCRKEVNGLALLRKIDHQRNGFYVKAVTPAVSIGIADNWSDVWDHLRPYFVLERHLNAKQCEVCSDIYLQSDPYNHLDATQCEICSNSDLQSDSLEDIESPQRAVSEYKGIERHQKAVAEYTQYAFDRTWMMTTLRRKLQEEMFKERSLAAVKNDETKTVSALDSEIEIIKRARFLTHIDSDGFGC